LAQSIRCTGGKCTIIHNVAFVKQLWGYNKTSPDADASGSFAQRFNATILGRKSNRNSDIPGTGGTFRADSALFVRTLLL
jgi:hypothetical protein